MQQRASTVDLIKKKKVPMSSKTRHLKLSSQRRNKKRMERVKKAYEIYRMPSKKQNM